MQKERNIEDNHPGKYNKRLQRVISYPQLLDKILAINEELKKAYLLKEEYLRIHGLKEPNEASLQIENYIISLKQYGTKETNLLRCTLNNWFDEIVNSYTFLDGKRISSGSIESKKSLIKLIKRNENGYKNFERFRIRCLYSINKEGKFDITGNFQSKKMKKKKE